MYRLYRVDIKEFVNYEYSQWDVCRVLFNDSHSLGITHQKNINAIMKALSFGNNDTYTSYWRTLWSNNEDGSSCARLERQLEAKLYRIYDEWDRIVSPHIVKEWLTKYDSEIYWNNRPPKKARVNLELREIPAISRRIGRHNNWKDHRI